MLFTFEGIRAAFLEWCSVCRSGNTAKIKAKGEDKEK